MKKKKFDEGARESALTVLRMLRDDVSDIILTLAAEDLDKRNEVDGCQDAVWVVSRRGG